MSRPLYSRFCTKTGNEEQTQKYTPFCQWRRLGAKTVLWNWWKPWGKNEFGPPPSTIRTRPPASRATKPSHISGGKLLLECARAFGAGVWSNHGLVKGSSTCGKQEIAHSRGARRAETYTPDFRPFSKKVYFLLQKLYFSFTFLLLEYTFRRATCVTLRT